MFTAKLNEVSVSKKSFLLEPNNLISLGLSLLINIIHWATVYFKIGLKDISLVLHYNVVYGTDFVERSRYIYIIPATALILFILNFSFAMYLSKKEKLASYFLNFSSIAVQVVFFVSSLIIIRANAG